MLLFPLPAPCIYIGTATHTQYVKRMLKTLWNSSAETFDKHMDLTV